MQLMYRFVHAGHRYSRSASGTSGEGGRQELGGCTSKASTQVLRHHKKEAIHRANKKALLRQSHISFTTSSSSSKSSSSNVSAAQPSQSLAGHLLEILVHTGLALRTAHLTEVLSSTSCVPPDLLDALRDIGWDVDRKTFLRPIEGATEAQMLGALRACLPIDELNGHLDEYLDTILGTRMHTLRPKAEGITEWDAMNTKHVSIR